MSPIDRTRELAHALAAVRTASSVCRSVQQNLVTAARLEKKDKSPVTVADFASQALVCAALAEHSAVTAIVGEEDAADLRKAGADQMRQQVVAQVRRIRGTDVSEEQALAWIDLGGVTPDSSTPTFWTLDPVDGTKGFLRGEQYAVALGLLEDGTVTVGVLGCPNLPGPDGRQGALLAAIRGEGAWILPLDGENLSERKAIHVANVSETAGARFCESVESGHSDHDLSSQIAAKLGITAEPVRVDSQAKYAILAQGLASVYLRLPTRKDYREKIWDHAAGSIVVQEAGGRVTDVMGAALDFSRGRTLEDNRGIVATSGAIHDDVIAVVGEFVEL